MKDKDITDNELKHQATLAERAEAVRKAYEVVFQYDSFKSLMIEAEKREAETAALRSHLA